MTFPRLDLHCLALAFPNSTLFSIAKSRVQLNTGSHFHHAVSLVQKKIWKVLHTLGKIPKFPLPRNANARKMLRLLQTICTSALFVTRILSFVWGFHCCLLRMKKGIPAEESGLNKKYTNSTQGCNVWKDEEISSYCAVYLFHLLPSTSDTVYTNILICLNSLLKH